MGVLSDLMGGGAGGKGGGAGIISKVGSALKRKKKKDDSPSGAGSNYAGDTGDSYKRGGKVKRTGLAKVHKNEEVLTAKEAKRYRGSRGKKR
jgi:hypothetical protein